jgi:hypothetical protein
MMGVVLILTPVVVGSWPLIASAVTAAAAGLGLAVSEEVKDSVRESSQQKATAYEMELDNSKIDVGSLASGKSLVLKKDNVTMQVSRDERGQLKVHASGIGRSQTELQMIAEEFVQKVNQCFIYNRTVTELKNKKFQMINEEVAKDGTIRIHVRRNEE